MTPKSHICKQIKKSVDALALVLYGYETEKCKIPAPSDRSALEVPAGSFVNYIRCDTMAYRKKFNTRAVKKTLSIPEWMNEEAVSLDLNFSQVLQDALLQKFHV